MDESQLHAALDLFKAAARHERENEIAHDLLGIDTTELMMELAHRKTICAEEAVWKLIRSAVCS